MINYRIAPISIKPSKKNASLSEVFVAQVDREKENLAGKLFILFETQENNTKTQKIINFLFEKLNQNYYQSDKLILREKIYSLKPEHIFEACLAKTNKQFKSFLEEEKIKIALDTINLTVGLIFDNEFYFSNKGKNKVFLLHFHEKHEEKNYKIVNISKQTQNEHGDKNKEELFSSVINGKIPLKSHIFITNEALPEYLSHNQIIDTISTLPPIGAAEQIKNILQQINFYIAFSGIIIKNPQKQIGDEKKQKTQQITQTQTEEKQSGISQTESQTEKILSSSSFFSLNNIIKNTFSFLKPKTNQKTLPLKNTAYKNKKIISYFKNTAILFLNLISYAVNFLKNKNILLVFRKGVYNIKILSKKSLLFFLNLKGKNKLLFFLSLLFIIFLVINITLNKKEQQKQVDNQEYQNLIEKIEKKQNQIEANLLYSNDSGAQNLFKELEKLLEDLPQETEEQKNQYNTFQKKFLSQLNLIRRATDIENPNTTADLLTLNENTQAHNIFFDNSSANLYLSDSQSKSIYIIDTKNNTITTATDLETDLSSLKYPVKIGDDSIVYLSRNSFVELKTTNESLKNLTVNFTSIKTEDIVGADSYNDRIYLLDKTKNQIFRYTKNGDNFSSPLNWLNEQQDFKEAVDISIDGNIYVLLKNGESKKFLRGIEQKFSFERIEPPLKSPIKIIASNITDYLYVLEPEERRLIVYDKNGEYIIQYISEKFDNLKDFSIAEEKKIAYVLNGNKILEIPFSHLE